MAIILTLGVYSVRVFEEFPNQATCVPLVFVYFTIVILMVLFGMIYFALKDYLSRRDDLPDWMLKCGKSVLKHIREKPKKVDSGHEVDIESSLARKCFHCISCGNCKEKHQIEKMKLEKSQLNARILHYLNRVVFAIFLFAYFTCYVVVWSMIGLKI